MRFKALQDPTCTQLLGSLVPGATMAFGARVPGTSHQLDPVQAASNIGTMVSWLRANDPALATASGPLADNLGAILAVADYRARMAIAEGDSPPRVRDLLDALIRAQELASLEWARSVHRNGPIRTEDTGDRGRRGALRTDANRVCRMLGLPAGWHRGSGCRRDRHRTQRRAGHRAPRHGARPATGMSAGESATRPAAGCVSRSSPWPVRRHLRRCRRQRRGRHAAGRDG